MSQVGASQSGDGERHIKAPLIIGLGASAGAMDSIERFFSRLSLDSDQALVLVLQHREAVEETALREVLKRSPGSKLSLVHDGGPIEGGGTFYLCPAGMITTIQGERFAVRKAAEAPGERATIDSFLVSLAEERAEDSIGVVLAGTGGDGTLSDDFIAGAVITFIDVTARKGEQVHVSDPSVRFQPKAAKTFALAVHELATNAIKYGALSQPSGLIEISWRIDEDVDPAQLIFDWRERGGPPATTPRRKGFGSELLEGTLAFELKGSTALTFNASGLHCTIVVPLNRRVVHTHVLED